jgi:hypothetical protein
MCYKRGPLKIGENTGTDALFLAEEASVETSDRL